MIIETINRIKQIALKSLDRFYNLTKKIIIPGFKGNSLYYVGSFFIKGIKEGTIGIRASSVAFSFFMAIFPAFIFLFSLIPFIPIDGFQKELFSLLNSALPDQASALFESTISNTIKQQRGGLLSIGFLLLIYFTSNGFASLIGAFNASYHTIKARNWFSERLVSIILVFVVGILLIIAVSLIILGSFLFSKILVLFPFLDNIYVNILFEISKWLLIILIYFIVISIMYYVAPAKKAKIRLITPGAIFATFFQIISVQAFSYYVTNFANYNKLYGSIGTIIIVMMLFYITAWVLILGYELNISTNSIEYLKEHNNNNNKS